MPGGENAIIVPPDPDRDRQEEILIEHITDWFGSKVPERDIIDCAAGAVDHLNRRRLSLLSPPELPPFIAKHIEMTAEIYQPGSIRPVVEAVHEELAKTFPLDDDELEEHWMGDLARRIASLLNPEPDSDDPRQWTIRLREGLNRY